MKNTVSVVLFGALAASTSYAASFTLNGTAISNAAGLPNDLGDTVVWVVNGGGAGAFSNANFVGLASGLSFADPALGGYEIAGDNAVSGGGTARFVFGIGNIDVTAGAGDAFGLLVFDSTTNETVANAAYTIFSDESWILPAPGAAITFGGAGQPETLTGGGLSSTVVPEPSTYAAFAGLFALGAVMLRRRRA